MRRGTVMNTDTKTDTEENKMLNKVVILVFYAHKKYSRSFLTLRLNYWCHMEYFNIVLTTFLGLECVSWIAVYGESESSLIKNILICVSKMNEGLTGLERHDSP